MTSKTAWIFASITDDQLDAVEEYLSSDDVVRRIERRCEEAYKYYLDKGHYPNWISDVASTEED